MNYPLDIFALVGNNFILKIYQMTYHFIKKILNRLPYIRGLYFNLERYKTKYPPGHYYSPIVDPSEIKSFGDSLFSRERRHIQGIELREAEQLLLLEEIELFYPELPFPPQATIGQRFYLENPLYSYGDAILLYGILRKFRPRRIIEAGSGFSSAAMLDVNQNFFENSIDLTFIEPYPERLHSLLRGDEKARILVSKLQHVPLETFDALEANDVLFIDSTHVSKTGSDVNFAFFEILPRLAPGVLVHFHDIHYPFEYPADWVLGWQGFGWNEAYLLRAFLMYNESFEILLFDSFVQHHHTDWFEQHMPLCQRNPGGGLWLRKK